MWFCDHPACLRQSLTSPPSTNRQRKLLRSKACRTMDSLARAGNGMAAAESLGQLAVINFTVSFIFAIAR
jgi:hypothetical protein